MRSFLAVSLGAFALAQNSLATPFDDFDDIALDGIVTEGANAEFALDDSANLGPDETEYGAELEARAATTTRTPYPTSFSSFPTENAEYAAMTSSQHKQYCATAKKNSPQYTRACIDGIWESLYGRTAAPEDEFIEATATEVVLPEITAAPEMSQDHQYAARDRHYIIPSDPEKSKAFVASLDDKCKSSSSAYQYVCSVWGVQKSTLATTTQPPVKREELPTAIANAVVSSSDAADVEDAAAVTKSPPGEYSHYRNVYVSSLFSICPTATELVVRAKCSEISSWYMSAVQNGMPAMTPAPMLEKRDVAVDADTDISEATPTTFATVTRLRIFNIEADAEDEDEYESEFEKRDGMPGGQGGPGGPRKNWTGRPTGAPTGVVTDVPAGPTGGPQEGSKSGGRPNGDAQGGAPGGTQGGTHGGPRGGSGGAQGRPRNGPQGPGSGKPADAAADRAGGKGDGARAGRSQNQKRGGISKVLERILTAFKLDKPK
ncbi:uncharacterized protein HMPREF1541_08259 [Cyphellophora europaea CBS 101466]|uniref:Uncharacterized protein n=1 Tax=Cyphellophora europaea (strain CBS 101466) TaxID=1220924 RepID=W2RNI9_CYPE1|nr:uncharacterized protein HMPREF1541_08259 [Cyphellophora europaea CBS 101466]ETN37268.1 hypothetical protein HMPREF1541_08259 [Cyphellophora europaea CBS 101466]